LQRVWRGRTGYAVQELYREEVGTGRKETEKRRETLENDQELRRLLVADFFRCVSNQGWLAPEFGESLIVSKD